jgi:lysozyme
MVSNILITMLSNTVEINSKSIENLIEDIKENEGFRRFAYIDPLREKEFSRSEVVKFNTNVDKLNLTVGYGCLVEVDKEFAEQVLLLKLINMAEQLVNKFGDEDWQKLPEQIKMSLLEMSYQLGVSGVFKFKKTINLLKKGDYNQAYHEALDSSWYKQTPNRAKKVVQKFLA